MNKPKSQLPLFLPEELSDDNVSELSGDNSSASLGVSRQTSQHHKDGNGGFDDNASDMSQEYESQSMEISGPVLRQSKSRKATDAGVSTSGSQPPLSPSVCFLLSLINIPFINAFF